MIDQKKKEIRKQIGELKKQYSFDCKKIKSKYIFDQIEKLNEFIKSKTIMVYWSMNDEVFTHDFILKYYNNKEIILPVVNGDNLELKKFAGLSNLTKGKSFDIDEPIGEVYSCVENIDLIIVPGVAFDKKNNRLGRGKAYYDKLLKNTNALKVGVCFDFQMIDFVPVDQYDIKMDLVISDTLK